MLSVCGFIIMERQVNLVKDSINMIGYNYTVCVSDFFFSTF